MQQLCEVERTAPGFCVKHVRKCDGLGLGNFESIPNQLHHILFFEIAEMQNLHVDVSLNQGADRQLQWMIGSDFIIPVGTYKKNVTDVRITQDVSQKIK